MHPMKIPGVMGARGLPSACLPPPVGLLKRERSFRDTIFTGQLQPQFSGQINGKKTKKGSVVHTHCCIHVICKDYFIVSPLAYVSLSPPPYSTTLQTDQDHGPRGYSSCFHQSSSCTDPQFEIERACRRHP